VSKGGPGRRAAATAAGWLAAGALLAGCFSAVPRVDAGLVRVAREAHLEADRECLLAGYEAYRSRCTGCHQLVPPGDHDVGAWPALVGEHRERIELTDAEVEAIVAYLQAGRLVRE
jgi:hypothetical protein